MPHEEKAAFRQNCRAIRRDIPATERTAWDAILCAKIQALEVFAHATALIAYWPTKGEIDLTPLFDIPTKRGIPVYLPRTEADGMRFYRFTSTDALSLDRFGIPSPTGEPLPENTAGMLCLLPGLAADKNGYRLGYGGGYYDRFLCSYQGNLVFPLYDCFVFDHIPHEAHDVQIPLIITEKGAYRYGKMDTATPTI